MKGWRKGLCVLAAGLSAFAANGTRAMILTTWQLPENEGAISGEKATEVAVLSIRRSLDETGTVVIYRTDAPGTLAACAAADEIVPDANRGGLAASFVENAAAGFAIVRSVGRAARGGGNTNFSASDNAANYDQMQSWNLGDNKGSGFNAWIEMGGDDPSRDFNDQKFAIARDGDVGRSFANDAQLDSGQFTVSADHTFTDAFSGFAVYSVSYTGGFTELLRWGVAKAEDREDGQTKTGFWYSIFTEGRTDYVFFGDLGNETQSVSANYELTWDAIAGVFTIAVSGNGFSFDPVTVQWDNATTVAAVGALNTTNQGDKFLRFDNLAVSGHVIPEPGTVSLLLLGVAVLGARRRK